MIKFFFISIQIIYMNYFLRPTKKKTKNKFSRELF